jgi:hypothetical protein
VQEAGFGAPTPSGYNPAQLRWAYGINTIPFSSIVGGGSGQTIAIVDAYDNPSFVDSGAAGFLKSDLARFDQAWGLPNPPSFTKLNEYGALTALPQTDPAGAGNPGGNWEIEEALDVEWAHAIAPAANIILIETNSANGSDMYQGVVTAAEEPGVSVVSMSWGSAEFADEQFFDSDFLTPSNHPGVTFVAATGDFGSPGEYPAYSPYVVAVGGTSLFLQADGASSGDTGWSGSGGGTSAYESEPAYQRGVQHTGARTIPDVAFDADPNSGVAVYDSYNGTSGDPWEQIGGTSLGAPVWSALFAVVNQGRADTGETTLSGPGQSLPALYSIPHGDFNDVKTGSNGSFSAGPGYDEVTGLGTPRVSILVPDLASDGAAAKLVVSAPPPESVTAGSAFGLTVLVEDARGSVETGYFGNVTVGLSSDPGATILGGNLTAMAEYGVASFTGLTLDGAGDGYKLFVTADGSDATLTGPFDVTPAAATRVVVLTQPPPRVGVNQPFGLTVAVEDSFGNLETSKVCRVTVVLASSSDRSILGGTLTVLLKNGVATFSNLTLDRARRGYALKANGADGLASAKTIPFRVTSALQASAKKAVLPVHLGPSAAARAPVKRSSWCRALYTPAPRRGNHKSAQSSAQGELMTGPA